MSQPRRLHAVVAISGSYPSLSPAIQGMLILIFVQVQESKSICVSVVCLSYKVIYTRTLGAVSLGLCCRLPQMVLTLALVQGPQ